MSSNLIFLPPQRVEGNWDAVTIGDAIGGGYYFGDIVDGNDVYGLVVSPASQGQSRYIQFSTVADTDPYAVDSLTNGWLNTNALNDDIHPAMRFARQLAISGYDDWYVPAIDELKLLYRNLKPTGTGMTPVKAFQQGQPESLYSAEASGTNGIWSSNQNLANKYQAQILYLNTETFSATTKASATRGAVRAIRRVHRRTL